MIERYVYGLAPQIRGMVAATEPKTMQKAVQISGALTDEAMRKGSIKKVEKRGNVGETSKDKNGKDGNKRTRTVNVFVTTVNLVGRENMGTWSKCTTCNSYHAPRGPCRTCFNYNRPGYLAKDCRGVPRNVNSVNARKPTIRACYECGSTDHVRSACPRLNRAQEPEGDRPNHVPGNNGGQGRENQRNQARGRCRKDHAMLRICHASLPYSHSPQPYYVTHPSSIIDHEEDYQGELQRDAQEDKLTTAMMEQMLLAMKDEAGGSLNEEENDFMLDISYGDDTLEELSVAVIIMAHIQPADAMLMMSQNMMLRLSVRIKQKSKENGQNHTNTDTGIEEHTKSWEKAINGQLKSTLSQPLVKVTTRR
ncbi:putative reverse transcriptase domain-containing protein [Tanacetum coccineum]